MKIYLNSGNVIFSSEKDDIRSLVKQVEAMIKNHFDLEKEKEFSDGARLEFMNNTEMDDVEKSRKRTGFIHLVFSVGGKADVDRMTEKLRNDGYEVISGPRTTGDGYYESCILDPEGNQIEITADR